jgi:hypothetical protein
MNYLMGMPAPALWSRHAKLAAQGQPYAFGHSDEGSCTMKAIMQGVLWVMVALFSCGNQSVENYDCTQASDEQFKQESSQGGVVQPDTGTPQPHPVLTPEEGEQLLRLKEEKTSPWETGADPSGSSGSPLPSEEKTPDAPGTSDHKAGETD